MKRCCHAKDELLCCFDPSNLWREILSDRLFCLDISNLPRVIRCSHLSWNKSLVMVWRRRSKELQQKYHCFLFPQFGIVGELAKVIRRNDAPFDCHAYCSVVNWNERNCLRVHSGLHRLLLPSVLWVSGLESFVGLGAVVCCGVVLARWGF